MQLYQSNTWKFTYAGSAERYFPPLLTLTRFASLAVGHVIEDIFHGATVGQVALPNFAVGLLPPLALVCVKKEYQLLLN